MMSPSYEPIPRLPRELAEEQLSSDQPELRSEAILSLALYDRDWKDVQERCLTLIQDDNKDVASTAVLALGHLARLHKQLDVPRVVAALQTAAADPILAGRVADALDDIEIFVGRHARPLE
jgi:HEAT repeat protein